MTSTKENTAVVTTRSDLTRAQIVERLVAMFGQEPVDVDDEHLRRASVDRFKKYTAVNGIFDGPIPAAVVSVTSAAEVSALLAFANEHRINVVARTGGTATEGGLETIVEDSIVLDGSAMNSIVSIDPINMMATAQCGVPLEVLEDAVRAHGLTTAHSPQSKPIAQMGGLTATRSIGQLSTLYGGIEDMVVGLEAVFPDGTITRIKNVPRRAAGPDIRHVIIGNEGALSFITEVTVKLFAYRPENNRYQGFLVQDMRAGLAILRTVITEGYRPAVCRLYSPEDARQHFGDLDPERCLLLFVSEGPAGIAAATADAIEAIMADQPHEVFDPARIESWFANLNWGMDKILAEQATMRTQHHLGYTTEISANWSQIGDIYDAVMTRIRTTYPYAKDLTMLGAHSSHSYQTGTNLYFVYDYDIDCEPRDEITKYHIPINAIIVEESLRLGGSMVHHHGIGKYRTAWTEQEHGSAYYILRTLKSAFDPQDIMNKGTIFKAN